MTIKRQCIQKLNNAIKLNRQLKVSIIQNRKRQAIDVIAHILYELGQTLLCINRLELKQVDKIRKLVRTPIHSNISSSRKRACLQLVDKATNNFIQAKRLIMQNRLEEAENIIASTITGRILRCVNGLIR